jgi:hypothetical protein
VIELIFSCHLILCFNSCKTVTGICTIARFVCTPGTIAAVCATVYVCPVAGGGIGAAVIIRRQIRRSSSDVAKSADHLSVAGLMDLIYEGLN